jgi:hypothetical protein
MAEAVTLVLDDSKTTVLPEWTEFLQDPNVGCELGVTASTIAGADPELTCTFTQAGLWNFKFDTSANSTQFAQSDYNVDNSVIIGLPTTSTAPGLLDILQKFGVADLGGNIPFDDGSSASDPPADPPITPPSPPTNLVQTIVQTLGAALAFKVDASETRNAFWITPGQTMRADVALTFIPSADASAALQSVANTINSHFGVSLGSVFDSFKIVLQKTAMGYQTTDQDSTGQAVTSFHVTSSYALSFRFALGSLLVWIAFNGSGINFTILQNPNSPTPPTPAYFIGISGLPLSDVTPTLSGILSAVQFLKLSATVDASAGTYWAVTLALSWGSFDIYFQYESSTSTFSGGLVLGDFYSTSDDQLRPDFTASEAMLAPAGYVAKYYWDIRTLSSELNSLPSTLPTALVAANISYQTTTKTLSLMAKLIAPLPPASTNDPQVPSPFTWDELDVSLSVGSGFSCMLASDFLLVSQLDPNDIGIIGLNIGYQAGDWILSGFAQNLNGAMLFGFFDAAFNQSLLSVLGKLEIPQLQVVYTYGKQTDSTGKVTGGTATSFMFVGEVQVGLIQLRLFYQYSSSTAGNKTAAQITPPGSQSALLPEDAPVPALTVQPATDAGGSKVETDWSFECDLGASAPDGQTATLGMVIDAIVPGSADSLPVFVSDVKIPSVSSGRSPITIKVAKHGTDQIAFAFQVEIEHVSFTFAQIGDKSPANTKRLLRIAVDNLPQIPSIPLIGSLIQPFDALEYLWVSDSGGLLQSEITALNMVLSSDNPLYCSANLGQPADQQATAADPVVIVPGHHFIVIQGKAAVLDHVFATATPTVSQPITSSPPTTAPAAPAASSSSAVVPAASGSTPASGVATTGGTGDSTSSGSDPAILAPASPPSKGGLTLSLGPLTISAISLQYQEQGGSPQISITLDAKFALGPIILELIGFGFSAPLKGVTLDNLESLFGNMSPVLSGMDISFNSPPLLIAGGFEHVVTATEDDYLGAIGISFPPYNFIGVGEYAVLAGYKSVFLYAKLNGRKFHF